MMECKHCNFKKPKGIGYPEGKPMAYNEEGRIVLVHENGCHAIPDKNEYRIECDLFGSGMSAVVNYCPKCGRKLGDTND